MSFISLISLLASALADANMTNQQLQQELISKLNISEHDAPVLAQPLSYCPIVPSTSGSPAWPIRTTSIFLRLALATSIWTLVTKGQVASKTVNCLCLASVRTS